MDDVSNHKVEGKDIMGNDINSKTDLLLADGFTAEQIKQMDDIQINALVEVITAERQIEQTINDLSTQANRWSHLYEEIFAR